MNRNLIAATLTSIFVILPASAQTIQWARQLGTTRVEEAFAVAAGPNSVYTAGLTLGAFSGFANAGNQDAFLVKFDTLGTQAWTRQFGTSGNDVATGVAADASGVYVVGHTVAALPGQTSLGSTDAFVRKYDVNGNELWTRQFGTTGVDEALGAAVDGSGFYVVGSTQGRLPGQPAKTGVDADAFVRKYDPNGSELWTRQFGTGDGDIANSVAVDTSGVYLAGSTFGALVSAAAGTDGFLRKYDLSGNVVWTRQITTPGSVLDSAYAVAVNSSGVYVSGETVGTFTGQTQFGNAYDAWAQKYDLTGNLQWTRQLGTTSNDRSAGIAVSSKWVYVSVYGSWDGLLQRYDLNGADTGALKLTANEREFFYGVAADSAGVYVSGSKDGSSLGQTAQGDLDALVLKVPNPPEISGISDAFTGQPGVAPTTWISIYGTNLAGSIRTWDDAIQGNQLPASIDGVSVRINNRPATIHFVSPGQVNVLAPLDDSTGNVQVTLTNTFGTGAAQVSQTAVLPAFYAPFGETKGLSVTAVALDGTLLGKPGLDPRVPRPVRPGEVVQFYATGFGRTNPAAPSDLVFSGAPEVIARPRITIGGREASVFGNGNLVAPGLYQFNLTIPDLADGDHIIQAEIGAARSSGTVFLSVRR